MITIFWVSLLIVLYTFLGYPLLIGVAARLWPRPLRKKEITPTVALLISAYNEADIIAAKIENSLAQDYPTDKLTIAVVADGSTDETTEVVSRYAARGVRTFFDPPRRGKNAAVNRVVPLLSEEILILTDANAMLNETAVTALVRNFADPDVACAAGEKRVRGGGEGLYWKYESFLKKCDSRFSSVMGAAGELVAVRRDLYQSPEPDTIIEDFLLSMRLVGAGHRVVYEPAAVAAEDPTSSLAADWERRVRNAAGGFQAIVRMPELLHPRQGRVWWQYLSHRVLRWAVTPFVLPVLFISSWLLAKRPFYLFISAGQTIFYLLGLVGWLRARETRPVRLLQPIVFFCLTNGAALIGFWRYIRGQQSAAWKKVR